VSATFASTTTHNRSSNSAVSLPSGGNGRLNAGPDRKLRTKGETGEDPAWFPDGIHVATGGAFDRPFGGARIINTDDGTARDVDGEVYSVNVDGTGLFQVTHSPGVNSVDWGPQPTG
jgi:hypothetical protein